MGITPPVRGVLFLLGALLALATAPVWAQEYLIGPKDVLKITVWGQDDLSKEYPVDADGTVPFPLIGRARAAGLTTQQFAAHLKGLLEKDYLVNPQVMVAVSQYLSKKVHVLGEAERAGLVYLTGPTTILEVMSKAGGWSKAAGRQLVLVRNGRSAGGAAQGSHIILRLDLGKIQAGDSRENILVEDEDMLFIPKSQAFFVLGEVKSAGTFPLDKPTTVLEALTIAGGFNERAAPGGTKIIRRSDDGRQETVSLDLSGAVPKDRDVPVQNGDTILVPRGNTFFVSGEVRRPGSYLLEKETNILEGITVAGGFTEKAAPGGTKIIRRSDDGRQETVSLDLSGAVPKDRDVPVQNGDTILVPRGNTFFVFGEVRRPGSYQLEKETNILEGITLAGGFTDKAAPGRVRVIRNTPTGQRVLEVDMNDVIKRGNRAKAIALQENDVVVVPESFF